MTSTTTTTTVNAGDALLHVIQNEWSQVLQEFGQNDAPEILKETLWNRPRTLVAKASEIVKFVRKEGLKTAVSIGISKARSLAIDVAAVSSRLPDAYHYLKTELTASLQPLDDRGRLIFFGQIGTYCASAAGSMYAGYSTPDKDITWGGIGSHRSILTHSILAPLIIQLLSRLLIRIVERARRMVPKDSPDLAVLDFLTTNLQIAATGFGLGLGAHLMQDGTVEGHKAINNHFTGTFVHGTLIDDNAWLLLNGVLSILSGLNANQKSA